MYSDILSGIKTSFDRDTIIEEISLLKKSVYESKEKLEETLKIDVRGSVTSIIRTKIEQGENIEKYLDGLATEVEKLTELKLELSFEPSEHSIDTIFSWVQTNVGNGTILDIETNPKILGGARISYKGKYWDGSLVKVLDDTLEASRVDVLAIISPQISK